MTYGWKKCESYLSQPPTGRWGATLTPIDNKLYLIGGNVVYYDLGLKTWKITDRVIASRSGHVATSLFGKYILIHGGNFVQSDGSEHVLGDFICINTEDDDLEEVNVNLRNDIVGRLCFHSWCIDERSEFNPIIYIFGGKNETDLNRRFFKLSITKRGETICIDPHELELPEGISPLPRMFHTLRFYGKKHISLLGGCSVDYNTIYNDSWVYNTSENEWAVEGDENEDEENNENEENGRSGHTAELMGKKTLFIFGGMTKSYETDNKLVVKKFGKNDDDNCSTSRFNSFILSPGRRRGHSSCHTGRIMFIFGGFNGNAFCDDLYMFGKTSDIEDFESEKFRREMEYYSNRNNREVRVPHSWRTNDDFEYNDEYDDKTKTKSYFYDSRLLSHYPFAYEVARKRGYDLNTITEELGKMINDCEHPEKIDEVSFSKYLDERRYRVEDEPNFKDKINKISQKTEGFESVHDINFPCVVCKKREISHVLIPCGCYCVCDNCADLVVKRKCPVCSENVESQKKLFVDSN